MKFNVEAATPQVLANLLRKATAAGATDIEQTSDRTAVFASKRRNVMQWSRGGVTITKVEQERPQAPLATIEESADPVETAQGLPDDLES